MLKKKTARGRPRKCRCVQNEPKVRYFSPQGVSSDFMGEDILITVDECQALCFADKQGLYQAEAAQKMNVSRQTFGNIIRSAHRKVAEAILCGRPLRIGGGTYAVSKISPPRKPAGKR